jgi:hypothetical protein
VVVRACVCVREREAVPSRADRRALLGLTRTHTTTAQGEVEMIAMMKPKAEDKNDTGLLEYLEDIIGTDKYVAPIEESAKK